MGEQFPIVKCPDCGAENSYRPTPMERLSARARRTCQTGTSDGVCGTQFRFILDDVDGPGWKLFQAYRKGN